MSKSAIYMASASSSAVAVGETVPLGSTVRRFGCNAVGNGDAVSLRGAGYYLVSFNATVAPTAAGTATVTMLRDGQPVQGASSSVTAGAAGAPQTASITAVVREFGCACDASSQLRFELSGADSMVSGAAVSVVKL